MKTEQLEQGNKLASEIETLESHRRHIEKLLSGNKKQVIENDEFQCVDQNPITVNIKDWYGSGGKIHLLSEFVSVNEFLFLYLMRLKNRIQELATEFEKL